MKRKVCFKCGKRRSLSMFYKHPQMADGHLNKCKDCARADVAENRLRNLDRYQSYDRKRTKGARLAAWSAASKKPQPPGRTKARQATSNAIRAGRLTPEPCEYCGDEPTHGHHDDYRKPLDVRWLCVPCHKSWHAHKDGKTPWRLIDLGVPF